MRASIIATILFTSLTQTPPVFAVEPSATNPIVVELFTSQGCSSCPPADAILRELAPRSEILALSFHVTYWNSLGWADPYALEAATARQRQYQRVLNTDTIYTPQMVVQGSDEFVGSDRQAVGHAIMRAAAAMSRAPGPQTVITKTGDMLSVNIGPGIGRASVLLVGFDRQHRTAIARGENAGRDLVEANIVRSLRKIGDWDGTKLSLTSLVPLGERASILLQAPDGKILGAGILPEHTVVDKEAG